MECVEVSPSLSVLGIVRMTLCGCLLVCTTCFKRGERGLLGRASS